jgi:transcriptional regulator with XRE-family HTH domain
MSKETKYSILSQRMRYAREKMGLSQEQLADLLGIKKPSISKWETIPEDTTKEYPNTHNIIKIANALGEVSLDWLLGRDNPNVVDSSAEIDDSKEVQLRSEVNFFINAYEKKTLLYCVDVNAPAVVPQNWIENDMKDFFIRLKKRYAAIESLNEYSDNDVDDDLKDNLIQDAIDKFIKIALDKYDVDTGVKSE